MTRHLSPRPLHRVPQQLMRHQRRPQVVGAETAERRPDPAATRWHDEVGRQLTPHALSDEGPADGRSGGTRVPVARLMVTVSNIITKHAFVIGWYN